MEQIWAESQANEDGHDQCFTIQNLGRKVCCAETEDRQNFFK